MNNRLIVVQSEGRKAFDLAFELFFTSPYVNAKPGTVTHYIEDPVKGLVLFQYDITNKAIKLPAPLNAQQAADLAWAWLLSKEAKDYKENLDHDGSNHKGFKVYNDYWNRVEGFNGSLLAVLPVWMWYGK